MDGTHAPGPPSGAEQVLPVAQSEGWAQLVLQAAAAQAYGVQPVIDMGAQVPSPSHTDAPSSVDPEQAALAQLVPAA